MVAIQEIYEKDRDFWDKNIAKFDTVHPLVAYGWGKVRAIDGWKPQYFMANKNGVVTGAFMILIKPIPMVGLSIMYAPRGPVLNPSDRETLSAMVERIRKEARKKKSIFLRIDPSIAEKNWIENNDPFIENGFIHLNHRWTFWNTPRDVYRIDLTDVNTEDELFMKLYKDARRCVRKAAKEGVSIRPAETIDELRYFYNIFKEFSIGKGFMSRGHDYQMALWNEFIERGYGRLFLAVHKGKIIGGLICLLFGRKCLAMHMGTPYKYQKLQTYYAYIWESVKWAWENNCIWYSFRGVGTTASQEAFKKKFGPKVISLVGYYDLPFYSFLYRLFYFGEFEILPRLWNFLMVQRKLIFSLRKKIKHRKHGSK